MVGDLARTVLGTLVLGDGDPRTLDPDDFTLTGHRLIHRAMCELANRGDPIGSALIMCQLENEPIELWRDELASVMSYATSAQNLESHVRALKRERNYRELRDGTLKAYRAIDSNPSLEDAAAQVRGLEHLAHPTSDREPTSASAALAELFIVGASPAVPLGLSGLNRMHVSAGNLCVIGARPGVGKTALLVTLALAAARCDWHVLFISLEMPEKEIRQRSLAAYAGIPLADVLSASDPAMVRASSELSRIPVYVDADHPNAESIRMPAIAAMIRKFALRHADHQTLVCVDYLQLVLPAGKVQNRVEAVGEVCRGLKASALQNKVPIIAAAQLSRAVEQRSAGSWPQLSDLRESGEIEQVSDQVVLLHRDKEQAWLRVAKNRHGECFTADARFDGARARFEDTGPAPEPWQP